MWGAWVFRAIHDLRFCAAIMDRRREFNHRLRTLRQLPGRTRSMCVPSCELWRTHYAIFISRVPAKVPHIDQSSGENGLLCLGGLQNVPNQPHTPKSTRFLPSLDGPIRANRFADSRGSPDSRQSCQGSRTEALFFCESRFGGLRIANRRFEAIRATRSHVMIFFANRLQDTKEYLNQRGT